MKLWLLASITGLALAAALLGLTVERTDSARQQPSVTEFPPNLVPVASGNMMSENQHLQGPAAHGDGNRAAEEYLNEHVINGKTTTICAEDKALHEALTAATQAWNQAFDNLAGGSVLTNHPNSYLLTTLDPVTGLPIEQTVTDCRGMFVMIVFSAAFGSSCRLPSLLAAWIPESFSTLRPISVPESLPMPTIPRYPLRKNISPKTCSPPSVSSEPPLTALAENVIRKPLMRYVFPLL